VSDLADRNNPPITHALMLVTLSTSLALLAASPGQQAIATFSALVFGLAYMSLTGLYLMTSIRLLPGRLAMGPVLPFVAVSLGQAVGSPFVGMLVDGFGYTDSFAMFAVFGTLVAIISPLYPRYLEYETPEEEIEDETGLQAAFDYQLQDEDGEPLNIDSGEAQDPYITEQESR
jgi:predicted MFS family arabinose efflux permease